MVDRTRSGAVAHDRTSVGRLVKSRGAGPSSPALLVAMLLLAWLPAACGDSGCRTLAPVVLPSGASPGAAVEGVAGGAKQAMWGQGPDLVELRIGPSFYAEEEDTLLAKTHVRGEAAIVYRMVNDGPLAMSWESQGCTFTVFLAAEKTVDDIVAYAGRY